MHAQTQPMTIRADANQLLPDGLSGERALGLSEDSRKETVTVKTKVLKEECP